MNGANGIDPRIVAAGESSLRRGLESLVGLARHVPVEGFGVAAVEYKTVPRRLAEMGVFEAQQASLLTDMAGYRNWLVHEYHQVQAYELFRVLSEHRNDLAELAEVLSVWISRQPGLNQEL